MNQGEGKLKRELSLAQGSKVPMYICIHMYTYICVHLHIGIYCLERERERDIYIYTPNIYGFYLRGCTYSNYAFG